MKVIYETSVGSLIKSGEELCGDKVEVRRRGQDTFIVLADGLGSGVKANILASLTGKIVITMLAEGTPIGEVVETMSATLPVSRERQIAYSTFTFIHADADGRAQIVEFDNPDTVLLRHGRSLALPRESREVSGMKIRFSHVELLPGDQLFLFSDGVVHAGVGRRLNLGWRQENVVAFLEGLSGENLSARLLRDRLLGACRSLSLGSPGDDATAAVCRVKPPSVAKVLVGPPSRREDDGAVVERFLAGDDIKIICGGTTGAVVSRVTGRELTTDLNYVNPRVPPMGHIRDIDLVTEGIITLSETLHLLTEYEKSGRAMELQGEDAACRLAQIWVEECTGIRFMVGRGVNPAREERDARLDLDIKLRLIRQLVDRLTGLDKKVEVEFY